MSKVKNQQEILEKLKIDHLNPMQEEASQAIGSSADVVLLSPTGTGKTLAFLLPILAGLDPDSKDVQVLILVPARELALQIELVLRTMGTGHKVNAIYGGREGAKDRVDLKHLPAILIGTPGRLADRLRRDDIPTEKISTLVLDEFDKSLEIGFEKEMREIIDRLTHLRKRILTSATHSVKIPGFVGLKNTVYVDYLKGKVSGLQLKKVCSPTKDKLDTLADLLGHVGSQPGLIFCNFKETVEYLSIFLEKRGILHGCFYGGLEQKDRERVLIKFRNGTHQLIIATDLAARGLDIPELKFIIHYQLPPRSEEFIHRNGRTARMNAEGTAYVIQYEKDPLPDFAAAATMLQLKPASPPSPSKWMTLFISGGRRDKISKSDIAGIFIKQGGLASEELGLMEIKQDCAFVAVHASKAKGIIQSLDNTRIKKKKVRISIV